MEDRMKAEKSGRRTFIMFLLAFLIGFFVVSVVEVLRSSLAPTGPGPDVQQVAAVVREHALDRLEAVVQGQRARVEE